MHPQNRRDLVRLAFIVQQDLQVRKHSPVQLELGPQLLIFIVQRSVTYALSGSFVTLDLPFLSVVQQAHFEIFKVLPTSHSALNAMAASVVLSALWIQYHVQRGSILISVVHFAPSVHLDFIARMSQLPER